jgi:hypothetical protein
MAEQRAERSLLWPGVLVGIGVATTVLLASLLLLRVDRRVRLPGGMAG